MATTTHLKKNQEQNKIIGSLIGYNLMFRKTFHPIFSNNPLS